MTKTTMETRAIAVKFLTPAFLGNAEQDGQWRTPPFKHLLREWWRVAWAEANGWSDDYRAMREQEGELFGSAAGNSSRRSRVRMRLDRWQRGTVTQWKEDGTVKHPEVNKPVGATLYLGYGPLSYDKGAKKTRLKANAAIQAGDSAELRLAFPAADAALIDRTLALIDRTLAPCHRPRRAGGAGLADGTLRRLADVDAPAGRDQDRPAHPEIFGVCLE